MIPTLYRGTVWHRRLTPQPHEFRHSAAFIAAPLQALETSGRSPLPRPLKIEGADYLGAGPGKVSEKLAAALPGWDSGSTVILTTPRSFLPCFNPISAYYRLSPTGRIEALAAEVRNTYGERYLYPVDPAPAQEGFAGSAEKAMYVSPFNGVSGLYRFESHLTPERARLGVTLEVGGVEILRAGLEGVGRPLAEAGWLDIAAVMVTGALALQRIAHQALILRLKGLRPVMKPHPPSSALRRRGSR